MHMVFVCVWIHMDTNMCLELRHFRFYENRSSWCLPSVWPPIKRVFKKMHGGSHRGTLPCNEVTEVVIEEKRALHMGSIKGSDEEGQKEQYKRGKSEQAWIREIRKRSCCLAEELTPPLLAYFFFIIAYCLLLHCYLHCTYLVYWFIWICRVGYKYIWSCWVIFIQFLLLVCIVEDLFDWVGESLSSSIKAIATLWMGKFDFVKDERGRCLLVWQLMKTEARAIGEKGICLQCKSKYGLNYDCRFKSLAILLVDNGGSNEDAIRIVIKENQE